MVGDRKGAKSMEDITSMSNTTLLGLYFDAVSSWRVHKIDVAEKELLRRLEYYDKAMSGAATKVVEGESK
jgi:hypothetical protein